MTRMLHINALPSVSEAHWLESEDILIFAMFQILEDFVEKQRPYDVGAIASLAWNGLPVPETERDGIYPGDPDADLKDWQDIFATYRWWKQRGGTLMNDLAHEAECGSTSLEDEVTEKLQVIVSLRGRLWT